MKVLKSIFKKKNVYLVEAAEEAAPQGDSVSQASPTNQYLTPRSADDDSSTHEPPSQMTLGAVESTDDLPSPKAAPPSPNCRPGQPALSPSAVPPAQSPKTVLPGVVSNAPSDGALSIGTPCNGWVERDDPPPVVDLAGFLRPQPLLRRKMPALTNIKHGMNRSVADSSPSAVGQQKRKREGSLHPPHWPQRPAPLQKRVGNNTMEKRWRVDIAHDALEFMKSRDWINWQRNRVNTRYEFPDSHVLRPSKHVYDTQIFVSCEDSINAALRILIENPLDTCSFSDIPLVLSMAHRTAAGGGFLHGARAQEEDLCRRSDLYMALQYAKYPLPEFGCNYTFPVSILRDSKFTNYRYLKATACDAAYFPQIGVISAAAYKDPKINDEWKGKMQLKVRNLFLGAMDSGHRIIILSAWGCGAFGNPPELVARFFKEALDGEFKGRFKKVIFAIATNKKEGNLGAFLNTFKVPLYYPPKGINLDPDPVVGMFGSKGEKQPTPQARVSKHKRKSLKASPEKPTTDMRQTADSKGEKARKPLDSKSEHSGKAAELRSPDKMSRKTKETAAAHAEKRKKA